MTIVDKDLVDTEDLKFEDFKGKFINRITGNLYHSKSCISINFSVGENMPDLENTISK